jgi:hypothetical protein
MPVSTIGTNGLTSGLGVTASTLSVNGNNISAVNSLGFRNRIINGNMVIDQRNAGASVNPVSGQYLIDRYVTYRTQNSKFTAQQNAGSVTPPQGFSNYLGITSSSAYSLLSTDFFVLGQHIEAFNYADLGWGTANAQTVTLSFWVRSSLTGTFGGSLINGSDNYSYLYSYTINAANTWEYKTVTIAGPTSGTWAGSTNGIGITLFFSLGTNSNRSAAAGSWISAGGSGSYLSATGATSVVGTNGATFYITGVQLEAGSVATPFEQIDYGRELIMCQRYCEGFGLSGSGADKDLCMGAGNGSGGNFQAFFPWKVQKRAAPTVSLAAASNFYVHVPGAFRVTCTSLSATDPTETGTHLSGVSSSGSFSIGQACFLAAIPTTALVIASAEL